MIRKVKTLVASAILGFIALGPAQAEEITVVTANLSPFTISAEEKNPGFLHEVVTEMKKRSGLNLSLKYLPWKRAQVTAEQDPNTLIFGLTRTKHREPKYSWLVKLVDTDKVFISTKEAYQSFDDAKKANRIAVRKATPFERQLKKEGFKNLIGVQTEKQNAQLLNSGRAEAWMTLSHRAAFVWKEQGFDVKNLKMGKSVGSVKIFLAGNKSFANKPEVKQKLQKAYDAVVSDGTFNKLHVKYFGSEAK